MFENQKLTYYLYELKVNLKSRAENKAVLKCTVFQTTLPYTNKEIIAIYFSNTAILQTIFIILFNNKTFFFYKSYFKHDKKNIISIKLKKKYFKI